MGNINAFFEKAGFVRVGTTRNKSDSRPAYSALYGARDHRHGQKRLVTHETYQKSRFAQPVYYVCDNRKRRVRSIRQTTCRRKKQSEHQ